MKLTERIIEAARQLGGASVVLESTKRCGYVGVSDDIKRWEAIYQERLKELEFQINAHLVDIRLGNVEE